MILFIKQLRFIFSRVLLFWCLIFVDRCLDSADYNNWNAIEQSSRFFWHVVCLFVSLDANIVAYDVNYAHRNLIINEQAAELVIPPGYCRCTVPTPSFVAIKSLCMYLQNELFAWRRYISTQDRRCTSRCVIAWYFLWKSFSESVESRRSLGSLCWSVLYRMKPNKISFVQWILVWMWCFSKKMCRTHRANHLGVAIHHDRQCKSTTLADRNHDRCLVQDQLRCHAN